MEMILTLAGLFFNDTLEAASDGGPGSTGRGETIGHSLSLHLRVPAEIPRPANTFR
jgi:hypothetical protein